MGSAFGVLSEGEGIARNCVTGKINRTQRAAMEMSGPRFPEPSSGRGDRLSSPVVCPP